jgi:nicotinate-nucleotide--dimethylbenzimidazole phosphoribosyltransferase
MTTRLDDTIRRIAPLDRTWLARAQARLDCLTKPVGSLGRLEELAAHYVAITQQERPTIPRAAVLTFVADHGIAQEGVSAYPQQVTVQMLRNFLLGGAGVNVLARHVGAEVRVVDIGVAETLEPLPNLIARKVAPGTKNFLHEPAMSREDAIRAIEIGIALAEEAVRDGIGLLGVGEMGIGNTTPSAAITAVMTEAAVELVTGRGTGIDDPTLAHKIDVIRRALARHRPDRQDPLGVVSHIGGLEIAGMAGVILGGAACRVPVMLDGFVTGAAALIAVGFAPQCRDYLIAAHRSVERGHAIALQHLQLAPLMDLQLRLGEGTGACLGIGLVQAALNIYAHMATFSDAAVSGPVAGSPAGPPTP